MNINPTRKVYAGGLAGALSAVIVWALGTYTSVQVPALVGMAIQTIAVFAIQWLVPNADQGNVSDDSPPKA